MSLIILDKRRSRDNHSEELLVIGNCQDKNVIVYDDLCDTAGSMCKAALALKRNGAKRIIGCVTHPVLSGNGC